MSLKVKGNRANSVVNEAKGKDSAYKALASSSQQKLFQKVLSNVKGAAGLNGGKEINSLQAEIQNIENLKLGEAKAAALSKSAKVGSAGKDNGNLNTLATSALLKLTALSSGGEGLSGYSMKASGLGRKNPLNSQTVSDAWRTTDSAKQSRGSGKMGALSSRFESGDKGSEIVGYDEMGGTSYGLYQISSRAGTMRRFIDYLENHAPNLAKRLKAAGPANTGNSKGAMPAEWKRMATEDPDRFAKLQQDFIEETHYTPALQEIYNRTGVNVEQQSQALKEVLWSTAVQHGPGGAAKIFCKAIDRTNAKGGGNDVKALIDSVYTSRAKQFGSSSRDVRSAVQARFMEEKALALAMLTNDTRSTSAEA